MYASGGSLLLACDAAGAGVEPGLKNEDGGYLVDDVFSSYALGVGGSGVAEGVEVAVSLGGGEALVPEVDREVELGAEGVGEGLGACGLGALVAGHVEGIADDGFGDGVFAQDAGYGFQVVSEPVFATGPVQGEERLGGVAEFVGECEADAAVAYVEAEDSGDAAHDLSVAPGGTKLN